MLEPEVTDVALYIANNIRGFPPEKLFEVAFLKVLLSIVAIFLLISTKCLVFAVAVIP